MVIQFVKMIKNKMYFDGDILFEKKNHVRCPLIKP